MALVAGIKEFLHNASEHALMPTFEFEKKKYILVDLEDLMAPVKTDTLYPA